MGTNIPGRQRRNEGVESNSWLAVEMSPRDPRGLSQEPGKGDFPLLPGSRWARVMRQQPVVCSLAERQAVQQQRNYYQDKTGTVPRVPYFVLPVKERDRYPLPTDL